MSEAPCPTSNAAVNASSHDKGVKVAFRSDHAGSKTAVQKDGVRLHLVCLDIEKLQHHSVQAVGGRRGRTNVGSLKINKKPEKEAGHRTGVRKERPKWQTQKRRLLPQSHKGSSEFPSSINSTIKSVRPADKGTSIK